MSHWGLPKLKLYGFSYLAGCPVLSLLVCDASFKEEGLKTLSFLALIRYIAIMMMMNLHQYKLRSFIVCT